MAGADGIGSDLSNSGRGNYSQLEQRKLIEAASLAGSRSRTDLADATPFPEMVSLVLMAFAHHGQHRGAQKGPVEL